MYGKYHRGFIEIEFWMALPDGLGSGRVGASTVLVGCEMWLEGFIHKDIDTHLEFDISISIFAVRKAAAASLLFLYCVQEAN
jgi:hypothetical protein